MNRNPLGKGEASSSAFIQMLLVIYYQIVHCFLLTLLMTTRLLQTSDDSCFPLPHSLLSPALQWPLNLAINTQPSKAYTDFRDHCKTRQSK